MNFHALQKHVFYTYNGVRVKYIYPTINHFVFVDDAGNEYKLSTNEVKQYVL